MDKYALIACLVIVVSEGVAILTDIKGVKLKPNVWWIWGFCTGFVVLALVMIGTWTP